MCFAVWSVIPRRSLLAAWTRSKRERRDKPSNSRRHQTWRPPDCCPISTLPESSCQAFEVIEARTSGLVNLVLHRLTLYKGIQIPECGKFLLMESGIRGCGIRNTASRNLTDDWNLESKFYWQILESSTWNPESHSEESRIQDCLGFPFMRRIVKLVFRVRSFVFW